jgi:selenocysteine lyase/cysteine desulfurase
MRIVSTTSEFHSLNRLLGRLFEERVQVVRVDTAEKESLTDRIVAAIEPGTTIVAVSLVFFDTGFILQDAHRIAQRAKECGALMIFDTYHAFNSVPFSVTELGADACYLGGGYKYTQSGEGAAWMRIPAGSLLRPLYTGWFADFGALEGERKEAGVAYATDGFRFAGATFDPTPFYRANAAFDLMERLGLTPDVLRARSLRLTGKIIGLYDDLNLEEKGLDLATPRDPALRAGFVSFEHPQAQYICGKLKEKNILTDSRGRLLRLGPAPYTTDEEILTAMRAIGELLA